MHRWETRTFGVTLTIGYRNHQILFVTLLTLGVCFSSRQARAYDVLCHNGNTAFEAYSHTGVQVDVGPPTEGALASRTCRAVLSWGSEELPVAQDASEIDLDMFGVDPGTGGPVAAFQIKQSDADCCMTYKIYSLEQPPRLLRTLRGGGYFKAADSNLTGQVEIWTDDAAAADGFEGFRASEMRFPPACVLRFDDGRLLDVSASFEPYFDEEIQQLRAMMNPQELHIFKLSDGRLSGSAVPPRISKGVLTVKLQVLELVWAYLYSHREKEAWKALAEMWPSADLQRIHAAVLQMRAQGMSRQVDGVLSAYAPPDEDATHAQIYDATKKPAQPIMVRFYPSRRDHSVRGKLRVDLVIDCAGKVWSVKVSGRNKAAFDSVKRSTANWKFIPALVDDQAVASRLKMTISLAQ